MAKSKIIKELVNGEISLSVALRRLLILANDIGLDDLIKWVRNETRGYETDDVPEYRKISSYTFHYSGINGRLHINKANLDVGFFNKETLSDIIKNDVKESISELEMKIDVKGEELTIDRSYLAGEVYRNSSDGWTGIQCTSIAQIFHPEQFRRIYNKVYAMTLDILIELDKKFGNLDGLDLDTNQIDEKEINEAKQNIQLIINYSPITVAKDLNIKSDNTVIGGGEISTSVDKKKIKDTNIGSGTNCVKKEFSPVLSIDSKAISDSIKNKISGDNNE